MEIVFVIVEPELPENVGACARALKTMGFRNLRLVNPCDHLGERARWVAHGSKDILKRARIYPDLAGALADADLVVGTTSKRRLIKDHYYSGQDLVRVIQNKGPAVQRVALVFGRESRGLLTHEIRQCDILSTVPIYASYPSLNLSHAVMIYAYLLSPVKTKDEIVGRTRNGPGQLRVLKETAGQILNSMGVAGESKFFSRVMERMGALNHQDIKMLHAIGRKWNQRWGPGSRRKKNETEI